jgi:hypothetical protein
MIDEAIVKRRRLIRVKPRRVTSTARTFRVSHRRLATLSLAVFVYRWNIDEQSNGVSWQKSTWINALDNDDAPAALRQVDGNVFMAIMNQISSADTTTIFTRSSSLNINSTAEPRNKSIDL